MALPAPGTSALHQVATFSGSARGWEARNPTGRYGAKKQLGGSRPVADVRHVGQRGPVKNHHDAFEQSAQIVEAFSEGEKDGRTLELLALIAKAIRDHATNDKDRIMCDRPRLSSEPETY